MKILRLASIGVTALATACSPEDGASSPEPAPSAVPAQTTAAASASASAPATVVVGSVDDPEALAAFLKAYSGGPRTPPLTAVAAATVEGGPAHPRITLVYLADHDWCGSGGCTLLVLEPSREGLIEMSRSTISHPPIRVLKTRSNSMPDLSVRVRGDYYPGDGPKFVALPFDGRTYALNPTVPPARLLQQPIEGEVVISEHDAEIAFRRSQPHPRLTSPPGRPTSER